MSDRKMILGLAPKPHLPLHFMVMLLLVMSTHSVNAQDHWLNKFDGVQACHIVDIVVDAAGSAYVIGDLSSNTTVTSGGVELSTIPTAGGPDVLVAKFAGNGSLIWARHAGGTSVDLGLKLALGPAGLAVTGVFTGSADLFGTNVVAEGGSTDLFLALLNPADGQAQWVRTAGSPGYTDTPGGITMNSAGDIILAGKFKGDAVFATETLHSAIDPSTALHSFDVFIAAWSSSGNFQWVKQGTGSKDCFAVDIVSGSDDQLYVTGQFSDTITFDVQHPGTVLNSIFLVKLDPQGNEQWFRRSGGGSFNQVSDLRWSSNNDLLMTGDVSGTMHWSDGTTSTPVANPLAHAYFILRAGASGALLDGATMGSAGAVHAASITEQADSVVVFGEFECSFTGLQSAYGADGLFIATGSPDLFLAKHAAADLSFIDAQQFAGDGAKDAGAIVNAPDGLLFSGAFTGQLYLPRGGGAWGDPRSSCSFLSPNANLTFCSDPYYGNFAWASGTGSATGFLTKGYVEGRRPYDFWDRSNAAPCDRGAIGDGVQIMIDGAVAPDTVSLCSGQFLGSAVPFPRGNGLSCPVNSSTVGPFDHQLWSTNSGVNETGVNSTGWVSFMVFSTNGCLSWKDSVFVNYFPLSISDSSGTYQNVALPLLGPIVSCAPMVVWVDQGGTDQVFWVQGTDTTFSDTIHISVSGTYEVTTAAGCGSPVIFEISVPLNVTGVTSQLTGSDSIQTCSANCLTGSFTNTWYVDSVQTVMPPGYFVTYHSTGGCDQIGTTDAYQPIPWGLELNGTGWYTVHSEVYLANNECVGPYTFTFTDSVYVEVGEVPSITFTHFEVQRCEGDTVPIPFMCNNCDSIIWGGPGLVGISPGQDTVFVDQNGFYTAMPLSQSGFQCSGNFQTISVTGPVPPPLVLEPSDGTICASDSVLLYTVAAGVDYIWTGPGTAFLPHADSIWVSEPGDYYLMVTLYSGCNVSNGPATVSFFGSPIISGSASGILCPGGSVDLHVQAGPGSTVQWQSPLSGNALVQTVYAPGTYACQVFSCGSSWDLSYSVVASIVSADLGADTFALCQNLPITLTAPSGASAYLWLPSGTTAEQLVVSAPGTYELIATDAGGCSDSSGPIVVVLLPITEPASAAGDSVCAGQAVTLTGSGSGDLNWYASPDTTELLAEGAVLTYVPAATDTVFLLQVENGCPGDPVPVLVSVVDVAVPVVIGDTLVCVGDTLFLTATGTTGSTYIWMTPNGVYYGNPLSMADLDSTDAGIYLCRASRGGCTGDTAAWSIVVSTCDITGPDSSLPNVITPNGDGVNDVFQFAGEGFQQAELRVFNRWGQQLAVVAGRNASWDGRGSYSGEVLSEGIYFYILDVVTTTGEPFRKTGYIHLFR